MSQKRIDMHRLQELVRMHRQGHGARKVARVLKMSPNTERKYRLALQSADLLSGSPDDLPTLAELQTVVVGRFPAPKPQKSSIADFEPVVAQKRKDGAQPRAIYDYLKTDHPKFSGSLSAVKRMCIRLDKATGVRPQTVTIPVSTRPGDVAQVDFGHVGKLFDPETGRYRKAYVFVMVLGHSRLMYADIVYDQSAVTWAMLHANAFAYLGGVPKTVVPDNLKAAVTRCYFEGSKKPELSRCYREVARHYGFLVDPTPPYAPHLKGKSNRVSNM